MKLLVDLGNTRLKWALAAGRQHAAGGVFSHAGGATIAAALATEWDTLAMPAAVLVASVTGDALEGELAAFVRARFGLAAEFPSSPKSALGITCAYAEPARFGIDRFLALAALHHAKPRAQVLASVGTALTLDALAADGRHLGGLIAPAPELMRVALAGHTARVGTAPGTLVEIADNTADAAYSGCTLAAIALIARFCAQAGQRLGAQPVLVLTGGGAGELAPLLPEARVEPDLVLRGLALWAESAALDIAGGSAARC